MTKAARTKVTLTVETVSPMIQAWTSWVPRMAARATLTPMMPLVATRRTSSDSIRQWRAAAVQKRYGGCP
jgi:hypothetical protein